MRPDPFALIATVAATVNVTDGVGDVDTRISTAVSAGLDLLSGVNDFRAAAATRTAMRNETLRLALAAFVASQQAVNDAQQAVNQSNQAILSALLAGADLASQQIAQLKAQALVQQARLDVVQAANAATQSQLAANGAADQQAVSRIAQLESQEVADHLADVALQQHDANQDAQLALLSARAGTDEALIATAQAAATAAQASATQAINAAAAAQAKADADKVLADNAQATATAAQQAAAANATTLAAVQADVATRLPASMVKRFTITTPAVSLVAGTPATFSVNLPGTLWADNSYFVFYTKAPGSTLLNVQLGDQAKLPGSFTATMQTTGLVTVAVGTSSAEVFVIHA